jgi:hypothetical protein
MELKTHKVWLYGDPDFMFFECLASSAQDAAERVACESMLNSNSSDSVKVFVQDITHESCMHFYLVTRTVKSVCLGSGG